MQMRTHRARLSLLLHDYSGGSPDQVINGTEANLIRTLATFLPWLRFQIAFSS
jgi:hypothetical protein